MGNKVQPGIFRGVDKYVNKTKYFHTKRLTKKVEKGENNVYTKERARMVARIKELRRNYLNTRRVENVQKRKK